MPNNNGTTTAQRDIGTMVEDARAKVEDARAKVEDVAGKAKSALATADRTLAAKMQENPLLVLGIAVGVGYMLGRLFSRIS